MSKNKQLTLKEIAVIGVKGDIANELHKAWETFFKLHVRLLHCDDRELRSMAGDISELVKFIEVTENEVNIKPVNLSKVQI